MKKFLLDDSTKTVTGKLANVGLGFCFMVFWVGLVTAFFSLFLGISGAQFFQEPSFKYTFFMACVAAPLWEELYYRLGMLGIAKAIGREAIIPGMVVSSVIFGLGHGETIWNLLVQGVMGFVFAMVYIKNGFSYWSSVLLHFLWNFFVIFAVPLF